MRQFETVMTLLIIIIILVCPTVPFAKVAIIGPDEVFKNVILLVSEIAPDDDNVCGDE